MGGSLRCAHSQHPCKCCFSSHQMDPPCALFHFAEIEEALRDYSRCVALGDGGLVERGKVDCSTSREHGRGCLVHAPFLPGIPWGATKRLSRCVMLLGLMAVSTLKHYESGLKRGKQSTFFKRLLGERHSKVRRHTRTACGDSVSINRTVALDRLDSRGLSVCSYSPFLLSRSSTRGTAGGPSTLGNTGGGKSL